MNAIVQRAPHAIMPVFSIDEAVIRFNAVVEFVSTVMREDVDFGKIPGTTKPTLLKPGAEKLCTLFGFTNRLVIVEKVEDWTGKDHGGEAFFYYLYRCQLWRGDLLIAEGDGSCNSWESKYRWRKADRVCPHCQQPAIKRSKFPPRNRPNAEPGWYCHDKAGGCGANFEANDPAITNQQGGRVANADIADIVNTLQKMAQKRALIAATLIACNASEFFTQDIEDMAIEGDWRPAEPVAPSSPSAAYPATNGNGHAKQEQEPTWEWATPEQIMQLVDAYRQWRPRDKRQNEALVDAVLWSACESKARTANNLQVALAAVKAWQFEEMEAQAAEELALEGVR